MAMTDKGDFADFPLLPLSNGTVLDVQLVRADHPSVCWGSKFSEFATNTDVAFAAAAP